MPWKVMDSATDKCHCPRSRIWISSTATLQHLLPPGKEQLRVFPEPRSGAMPVAHALPAARQLEVAISTDSQRAVVF